MFRQRYCLCHPHLESVRVEPLLAVGATDLGRKHKSPELVLNGAVGCQHNISPLQLLSAGAPFAPVINQDLKGEQEVSGCEMAAAYVKQVWPAASSTLSAPGAVNFAIS